VFFRAPPATPRTPHHSTLRGPTLQRSTRAALHAVNLIPKTPNTASTMRRITRVSILSFPIVFAGVLLFGQLLWLIYVKSMASSASHQTNKLDMKIAQMQDDIARAQKKISAATSTAQLEAWAKQPGMKLRLATQADIDLVSPETKPKPAAEAVVDSLPNTHNSADNASADMPAQDGGGHAIR
jgi:cell division protein FtsL